MDDTLLTLINASPHALAFVLPPLPEGTFWHTVLDTRDETPQPGRTIKAGAHYRTIDRSLAVLRFPFRRSVEA